MKEILFIFKKFFNVLSEMVYLIRKHKLYFIAPLLIMLALLVFLAFYLGHSFLIVSFIYAGV